jgi:hypothetical protein
MHTEWMDGWMDGRVDGWIDVTYPICVNFFCIVKEKFQIRPVVWEAQRPIGIPKYKIAMLCTQYFY